MKTGIRNGQQRYLCRECKKSFRANGKVSGDPLEDDININSDRDYYKVDLVADQSYRINLRGSADDGGDLEDPQLLLVDANNAFLTDDTKVEQTNKGDGSPGNGVSDRNSGEGVNARIEMDVKTGAGGAYYIAAMSSGSSNGTYTLTVVRTK